MYKIALVGKIKENYQAFKTWETVGPLGDQKGNPCIEPDGINDTLDGYLSSIFTKDKYFLIKAFWEGDRRIPEVDIFAVLRRINPQYLI